jgi:hypothetical protein
LSEQTLKDGAVAYYEINEAGSIRNSKMPYPINEYCVAIPASLVLSKEQVPSKLGEVSGTLWSVAGRSGVELYVDTDAAADGFRV